MGARPMRRRHAVALAPCGVRVDGLAHDVADSEDLRHVGAHLSVNIDEAAVGDRR
jgi:hypothetical protein